MSFQGQPEFEGRHQAQQDRDDLTDQRFAEEHWECPHVYLNMCTRCNWPLERCERERDHHVA
jgi:hypothetical protein